MNGSREASSIYEQIFEEIEVIYSNGLTIDRPTKSKQQCLVDITNLFRTWVKCKKNQKRKPTTEELEFLNSLEQMFDIVAIDAEDQIQKDRLR